MKSDKKRIEDLERRVRELEARPLMPTIIVMPSQPPPPIYPWQPLVPWGPVWISQPSITYIANEMAPALTSAALGANNGGIYS